MTPAQFEDSALGAALAFVLFALAVIGYLYLEWQRSHPRERQPRTIEELPAWRALLLAGMAWLCKPWPFTPPRWSDKFAAWRDIERKKVLR